MHRPNFSKTALYKKSFLALPFTIQIEPNWCWGSGSNKNIKPKFIKRYECLNGSIKFQITKNVFKKVFLYER